MYSQFQGDSLSLQKDQEVPIAGSSAFHSLEKEAESELQEIQNMLSVFDDHDTLSLYSEIPWTTDPVEKSSNCLNVPMRNREQFSSSRSRHLPAEGEGMEWRRDFHGGDKVDTAIKDIGLAMNERSVMEGE